MNVKLKHFLQRWAINTVAVLIAVYVVPGLHFRDNSILTPFVTSLVLGILNAFIRPIMMFVALPLLIFTLGLFTLIINALLLYLVGLLMGQYFEVANFWSAFLGALVISIVSTLLNILTGTGHSRMQVKGPPGKGGRSGSGKGPVIDI